jgi:hypothetical protein
LSITALHLFSEIYGVEPARNFKCNDSITMSAPRPG